LKTLTVALIGAGQRGKDVYGEYMEKHPEKIRLVAVAEPDAAKREEVIRRHHIDPKYAFPTWEEMLALPKFCDCVIIATSDDGHFEPAMTALEKGYHLLLEKPMSNRLDESLKIARLAEKLNRKVVVSHVLRYTPFFSTIKKLLEEKKIGDVITVQHNENIGFFHFAHSYVRGNWRNSSTSSPLVLAKCCHDLDILVWLLGKKAEKIAAFGNLKYFREENRPEKAADYCVYCPLKETCPYSATTIYSQFLGSWPATVVTRAKTKEELFKVLETSDYGRCVFRCDNDVVDHMSIIIEFEDGITATFNISAFTHEITRTIKIMGTKGEIRGHMEKNEIELYEFGQKDPVVYRPELVEGGGHMGGDYKLMDNFVEIMRGEKDEILTSAQISVQSHIMAFAAEKSRLENKIVDIETFRMETEQQMKISS
jgi:Oxidoreductase family, C-terminal alpha/beta domain./Oxidoreductase family, NAD-binding Rossmann fold.